jgi:hypothetical protein
MPANYTAQLYTRIEECYPKPRQECKDELAHLLHTPGKVVSPGRRFNTQIVLKKLEISVIIRTYDLF